MFAQRSNFTGQRPDQSDTLRGRTRNNVIAPGVGHAADNGVRSIHNASIPIPFPRSIKLRASNYLLSERQLRGRAPLCHVNEDSRQDA